MPIEVDMGTESDGVSFEEAVEEAPEVEIDLGDIDAGLAGDREEEEEDVQVEFDGSEVAGPGLAVSPEDRTQPPGTPAQALEAPESPPPEAAAAPARDELGEVDEYIALGLYEDARHTLRELLKKRPGDEQLLAKIDEVGFSVAQLQKEAEGPEEVPEDVAPHRAPLESALETGAREPEQPALQAAEEEPLASLEGIGAPDDVASLVDGPHGIGDDFVDLASELSDEVFGTQNAVDESTSTPEPPEALTDPGLDEMFREFKKGVEKQLGTEDYDTRYNLGIAYKEMGLLDEAIAEFQLASKDQNRLLECCSMLGLCFMEKGMPTIAIKWFEKGLSAPGRSEEEQLGLRYDLAQAHEAAGESERALELYMNIEGENNKFRDVREKVRGLQAAQK
jgi:tetratricopeptide (TPR) repeat protein